MSSHRKNISEADHQLVDDVISGQATQQQWQELSALIATNPDACQFYVTSVAIHAKLSRIYSLDTTTCCPDRLKTLTPSSSYASRTNRSWKPLTLLASLFGILLTVGFASLYLNSKSDHQIAHNTMERSASLLGEYEIVSSICNDQPTEKSSDEDQKYQFHSGDHLKFPCQTTRLTYESGVVMTLTGPAELIFENLSSCRLLSGKVVVHVPEGAQGFRVKTAKSEIIDYGTEFGVSVNEQGESKVAVFEGEVGVGSTGSWEQKQLYAGQGVIVDRDGNLERLVLIDQSTFSEEATPRSPIIADVQDNIRSPETYNYYRIISGSPLEDGRIYVDRVHEFNGVTEAGVPEFLQGGELLMTFNDDKVTGDFHLTLTLAQPADLYILYDKRLEIPVWLAENFTQLDDVIGVDEQTRTTGPERLGIGPGVSVDNIMSIWKRRISQPGTIVLGHNGNAFEKRNLMYSVIAQPIGGIAPHFIGKSVVPFDPILGSTLPTLD